jgi:hypothetical protein
MFADVISVMVIIEMRHWLLAHQSSSPVIANTSPSISDDTKWRQLGNQSLGLHETAAQFSPTIAIVVAPTRGEELTSSTLTFRSTNSLPATSTTSSSESLKDGWPFQFSPPYSATSDCYFGATFFAPSAAPTAATTSSSSSSSPSPPPTVVTSEPTSAALSSSSSSSSSEAQGKEMTMEEVAALADRIEREEREQRQAARAAERARERAIQEGKERKWWNEVAQLCLTATYILR